MTARTNNIAIQSGSDNRMPAKDDIRNKTGALITFTNFVLICGICILGASLNRFLASSTSSSSSSADKLLDQIAKLTHDLDAFEKLKEQFTSDEIELLWDKQHIADLEGRITEMKTGFGSFAEKEIEVKRGLKKQHEEIENLFVDNWKRFEAERENDQQILKDLVTKVRSTHQQMQEEHIENESMKRALEMMTREIERSQKARLRGSK
eukprot:CAMPEP_0171329812 /NCGR_PEP_ID=MMETSP0878-20121228/1555_1 /TAXON_ID=67004 /ORGANISM="Thalassiosira weissflogii, Strain CCMP1336" /LENGTH=207 /DNA_ID=CAMNT_0011829933 /DNA_START=47 /DNA_END=670 /DNA_ORIENTATION=-